MSTKFGWSLIFKIHPLLDRHELKLHLLHSEFSWAKLFAKWKKINNQIGKKLSVF
jgi:hypothetical protein